MEVFYLPSALGNVFSFMTLTHPIDFLPSEFWAHLQQTEDGNEIQTPVRFAHNTDGHFTLRFSGTFSPASTHFSLSVPVREPWLTLKRLP